MKKILMALAIVCATFNFGYAQEKVNHLALNYKLDYKLDTDRQNMQDTILDKFLVFELTDLKDFEKLSIQNSEGTIDIHIKDIESGSGHFKILENKVYIKVGKATDQGEIKVWIKDKDQISSEVKAKTLEPSVSNGTIHRQSLRRYPKK